MREENILNTTTTSHLGCPWPHKVCAALGLTSVGLCLASQAKVDVRKSVETGDV